MGFMDTIKSKFGGKKEQANGGIDKAPDAVGDKPGADADEVDKGAEMDKGAVDKLPDA